MLRLVCFGTARPTPRALLQGFARSLPAGPSTLGGFSHLGLIRPARPHRCDLEFPSPSFGLRLCRLTVSLPRTLFRLPNNPAAKVFFPWERHRPKRSKHDAENDYSLVRTGG